MSRLALALSTLLFGLLVCSASARADEQFSARGSLGFGERKCNCKGAGLIVPLAVNGDMLLGPNRPNAFRFGLAGEGRTTNFKTIEGAGGMAVLVPMPFELSLELEGMIGLAWRAGSNPDGWMGIGIATLGYHGYNYHGWYSWAINAFFSGRKQINDDYLVEFVGGIEVDLLFTTVIPYMAIKNWMSKSDPHED